MSKALRQTVIIANVQELKTIGLRWGSIEEEMLKQLLLISIGFYQKEISPFFLPSCRFYPSCSNYASLSLQAYPLPKAIIKTLFRICRCHPWHRGGVDLP